MIHLYKTPPSSAGPLSKGRGGERKGSKTMNLTIITQTPAMSQGQGPTKRIKTGFDNARNRLSMMASPVFNAAAATTTTNDGRRSRLMGGGSTAATSVNRNSMPLPPRHPLRQMTAVMDFPSGTENQKIKVCFVGNRGCGKTQMIE